MTPTAENVLARSRSHDCDCDGGGGGVPSDDERHDLVADLAVDEAVAVGAERGIQHRLIGRAVAPLGAGGGSKAAWPQRQCQP